MVISGFWGFATVLVLSIVILAIYFSSKVEKTIDENGNVIVKETSYELRWGFNKTN
jgi:hypothetical protein